jgi:hypothetical protein
MRFSTIGTKLKNKSYKLLEIYGTGKELGLGNKHSHKT